MSDIFQEVDEEVRRDQLKKLWDRYQNYVIAAVTLVILAVAGWRGYEYWQAKKAEAAGSAFEAAAALSAEGQSAEAESAFAKVAAEGTPVYRSFARLREASELASRDHKAAIELYDAVANDTAVDAALRDLAGLRAGTLLIDDAQYNEARARLEPLAAPARAFRHSARELLALAAWRAGDTAGAKRWIDMMATDAETPSGIRSRIDILRTLLTSEGKS